MNLAMLKELDPEKIREMLKGTEDTLSEDAKKLNESMRNAVCPRCGEALQFRINMENPFLNSGLPRFTGTCESCDFETDLDSGISNR